MLIWLTLESPLKWCLELVAPFIMKLMMIYEKLYSIYFLLRLFTSSSSYYYYFYFYYYSAVAFEVVHFEFLHYERETFGGLIGISLEFGQCESLESCASAEQWRIDVSLFGALGLFWIVRVSCVHALLYHSLEQE